MEDLLLGIGGIAFGAIVIALSPRMYRDPLTTDVGWQQIQAENSPLGPRFGRSAYRARFVLIPAVGPFLLLAGVGSLLGRQGPDFHAVERVAWSMAAAVMAIAWIVSVSIFLFGWPDVLLPARLRGQPGFLADDRKILPRPKDHEVTIMDVRPGPGDSYGPYFVATCQCGWLSGIHHTAPPAFDEARKHDPNVKPEVSRPVS